jgi:hypothetical protein
VNTLPATVEQTYNRQVRRTFSRPDLWGWLILPVCALVLRLGYAATLPPQIVVTFEADPLTYDQIARNVVAGRGFSGASFYYPPGTDHPTAFWDALYPLFLAALYWAGGPSVPLVRIAQAVLGATAVALTFFVGRRLAGTPVGLLAAAISAVYPFFIYYSGQLLTETLFMALILGIFATGLQSEKTGHRRWIAAQGVLTGLATLCRAEAFLFGLALLCWTAWRSVTAHNQPQDTEALGTDAAPVRRMSPTPSGAPSNGSAPSLGHGSGSITRRSRYLEIATFCLTGITCVALVMSPWVVRNYLTFGQPVLTTTKLGYNLYKYYHPEMTADQTVRTVPFPEFGDRREPEREALMREHAIRFMAQDPGRTLWFMANKLVLLFKLTPSNEVNRQYALISLASYGALLPFMALGLVLAIRRGNRFLPIVAYVLFSIATKMVVFAGIRLRMQIEPFLIILAATALVALSARLLPTFSPGQWFRSVPRPSTQRARSLL